METIRVTRHHDGALSADRREGIAAFVQKRRPVWPGH
jgi:enoyl-CoA hydratase/carnithine racemase